MPTPVQELYASTAASYRQGDSHPCESLEYFRRTLASLTGAMQRPIDVLDLGCGSGRYFHCYQNARRIAGVDLSWHMLAEALSPHKQEEISASTITLTCANVQDLPLPPGAFDFICSVGLFGLHTPLTPILLNRIAMALRPGGRLCLHIKDADTPVACSTKRRAALACLPHLPPPLKGWLAERLRHYAITHEALRRMLTDAPLTDVQVIKSRDIDPDRQVWRRMWLLLVATK